MQTISLNRISQKQHGIYKAVDISPSPDPDYYAPEDGIITAWGVAGTMGLRLEFVGASGRHGFGHNEKAYVKVGDRVKRGQKLARMGYTGLTVPDDVPEGTHVHWVIKTPNGYVYPISLVNEAFIKEETMPPDYAPVNDGDIINWLRWAKQNPNYQPTGPEFDHYKAKGWKVLAEDTRAVLPFDVTQEPPTTVLNPGVYKVN